MRDDVEFNIKFIKIVEQNPPLYDPARCDSVRLVQEQIWEKISKILKEPVNECRERWKNIRNRYVKVQKKMRESPKQKVKEYYLGPHLHFLDGFLNKRPPKNRRRHTQDVNVTESTETMDADDASSDNDDEFDQSFPLPDRNTDFDSEILLQPNPLQTEEDGRISHDEDSKAGLAYLITAEKGKSKEIASIDSAESDFSFLKSLLPDMAQMTSAQKRYFKICVLNMAGQILEGRETVTVSTSSLSKF